MGPLCFEGREPEVHVPGVWYCFPSGPRNGPESIFLTCRTVADGPLLPCLSASGWDFSKVLGHLARCKKIKFTWLFVSMNFIQKGCGVCTVLCSSYLPRLLVQSRGVKQLGMRLKPSWWMEKEPSGTSHSADIPTVKPQSTLGMQTWQVICVPVNLVLVAAQWLQEGGELFSRADHRIIGKDLQDHMAQLSPSHPYHH